MKETETQNAERVGGCAPADGSAPTIAELLQQYVSESASWNRSINMKLSLKTRTARGKKSETAFRKLQAAIEKAQNS
jgi:hypothetical protein